MLAKILQPRFREKAAGSESGVEGGSGVAFAQDEAVAIGCLWIGRIDPQYFPVRSHDDVDARQDRTQVRSAGVMGHLDRLIAQVARNAYKIGEWSVEWHIGRRQLFGEEFHDLEAGK